MIAMFHPGQSVVNNFPTTIAMFHPVNQHNKRRRKSIEEEEEEIAQLKIHFQYFSKISEASKAKNTL